MRNSEEGNKIDVIFVSRKARLSRMEIMVGNRENGFYRGQLQLFAVKIDAICILKGG